MNEGVVYLIASIIVVVAWFFNSAFIISFARHNLWNASLVGRTQMQGRASMWLLLTYALTARWLDFSPALQHSLGLTTYALIALMEARQFLVLRYTQAGHLTFETLDYHPVRDWWKSVRSKKEKR
jgi:hypothetical protein